MANLLRLYRYQEIESRLQVLKKNRANFDSDPELLDWKAKLREFMLQKARTEAKQKEVQTLLFRLDMDLKGCQELLRAEDTKLYNGKTTSSRELELIQQKVAEYSGKRSVIEEKILVLMEEDEQSSDKLRKMAQLIVEFEQQITVIDQKNSEKILEISFEEQELQGELSELTPTIPTDWLEKYRKIAQSHRGIGIARIKKDNCGACHTTLSDALMQKAKRGEDILVMCENCGRIIFY